MEKKGFISIMGFTVNDLMDNGYGGETAGIYVTLSRRCYLEPGSPGAYNVRAVIHFYASKAIYDAHPQKQLPLETTKSYPITAEELNSGDNIAILMYTKLKADMFAEYDITDDL